MSYSADEVMVAVKRLGKDGEKFVAAEGWRIVDVMPIGSNMAMIVMVPA